MNSVEFLCALLPTQGIPVIVTGPHPIAGKPDITTFHHHIAKDITDAAAIAERLKEKYNVYFAIHTIRETHERMSKGGFVFMAVSRTAANAAFVKCLYLDIDVGTDPSKYSTQFEAVNSLVLFCRQVGMPKPTIVNSGYGVHVYWPFVEAVTSQEWKPAAELLKRLTAHHGLKADPAVTADAARILRVVGTWNRKDPANPFPVVNWHPGSPPTAFSDLAAILAAASAKALPNALLAPASASAGETGATASPPETPENVELLRGMLDAIDPGVTRDDWRRVVWGVASLGWTVGEAMARSWSARWDKFAEADFATMWASFDAGRQNGITWRSLHSLASGHGYMGPNLTVPGGEFGTDLTTTYGISGTALTAAAAGSAGDVANGRRFAAAARDRLLHIYDTGQWLRFDPESGWLAVPAVEVEAFGKGVVRAMTAEAAEKFQANPESQPAKRLRQNVERVSRLPHLRAMIEGAMRKTG